MTAIRAILPYKSYRFSGDDTLTFLQGQLTQDVGFIQADTCHYGAFCNPKAQMLANFLIVGQANDYTLRLHARQADSVIKRLQLFILRAQVKVEAVTRCHIGLNQAAALQLCEAWGLDLPEPFACVNHGEAKLCGLPNGYFELLAPDDSLVADIADSPDAIAALRLSGGHFDIVPENAESLMPQLTPLEVWGGINYKKGCYVGQEIIARNHYKGKIRKGLGYAVIDASVELTHQTPVMVGNKKGQVVDFHRGETQTLCLALLLLDCFEQAATVDGHATQFVAVS